MSRSRKKTPGWIIGGDRRLLRQNYRSAFKQASREGKGDDFPKFTRWCGYDYIDYRFLDWPTNRHRRCLWLGETCEDTYSCEVYRETKGFRKKKYHSWMK